MLGITLAFSLMPGALAALKAATLWLYPLDQTKVDLIERELRERRADDPQSLNVQAA
jgi:GPH family glycoside/pentoside/hexuronide:cation symporter